MEFIITNQQINQIIKVGDYFVYYKKNEKFSHRDIHIENSRYIIIGESNKSFQDILYNSIDYKISIQNNIELLSNGYIVCIDKIEKTIDVFNDIFGFFHLFYIYDNLNNFYLSSNYNDLLKYSNKKINDFAILDIILFNYTLFDRTTFNQIKRATGGTVISFKPDGIKFNIINNFSKNFRKEKFKLKFSPETFGELFQRAVVDELFEDLPVKLSMTAGFDSRALLAATYNFMHPIQTYTFGQRGNIESEILSTFISRFSDEHNFIELDNLYVKNLSNLFNSFIKKNIDNPFFHSMVEFEYLAPYVQNSNILLGFMGGEFINGQAIGAQVMITELGSKIITSKDPHQIKLIILNFINNSKIINKDYFYYLLDKYIETLEPYKYRSNNLNILEFMINEEYSKIFGSVNKLYSDKSNIITPFANVNLLNNLLNSDYSFLKKRPFEQNPIVNLNNKVLYGNVIKYLQPLLLDTQFDRLYKVKHLTSPFHLLRLVTLYSMNHFFKKNKVKYTATTRYDMWYKDIVYDKYSYVLNNKREFEFLTLDEKILYGAKSHYDKVDLKLAGLINAVLISKEE